MEIAQPEPGLAMQKWGMQNFDWMKQLPISLSPSLLGTTMKEAQPAMAEKRSRIFD